MREALGLDELNYSHRIGYGVEDARAYYLYGCIDETFKACTAILRWMGFLNEPAEKVNPPENTTGEQRRNMDRVVTEAVVDEQQLWARKLNELLSDLILFQTTNEQPYYRIYLASRHLESYLGLQADCDEFFDCTNSNAATTVQDALQVIEAGQGKTDVRKLWFLNAPLSSRAIPRPGSVFRSARSRFKEALRLASPDQRIALGISYETGYSRPSRSLHANIGGFPDAGRSKAVERNLIRIGILASHVVSAAYTLAGVKPHGIAAYLQHPARRAEARALFDERFTSDFAVGDIVTPHYPDVCEIVEKKKSKYGYVSYKMRFLTPPLLPGLLEDWYPAGYVRLLCTRDSLRKNLVEIFAAAGATPEQLKAVRAYPDADLTQAMKEVLKSGKLM